MATLKEIEVRIQEHENRLLQLQNDRDKNHQTKKRIEVMIKIIAFWKNQKEKAIKTQSKTT
jgi:hypothetical protein